MASSYLLSATLTDKLVVATAFVTALFIYLRNASYCQMPYPPGPKGVPFLGNIWDVPKDHGWFKFKEIGDTLGAFQRS